MTYIGDFSYAVDEIPHPFFLSEEKQVMEKPYVLIEYSSGKSDFKKHFETFEAAEQYASNLMDGNRANYVKIL